MRPQVRPITIVFWPRPEIMLVIDERDFPSVMTKTPKKATTIASSDLSVISVCSNTASSRTTCTTSVLESAVPTVKLDREKSHINSMVKMIWLMDPPSAQIMNAVFGSGSESSPSQAIPASHISANGAAYIKRTDAAPRSVSSDFRWR